MINKQLQIMAKKIKAPQVTTATIEKSVLTFPEACKYLGVSDGYLRRLVSKKQIPYCKPAGKLYFLVSDLIAYVTSGRVATDAELERKAQRYCMSKSF